MVASIDAAPNEEAQTAASPAGSGTPAAASQKSALEHNIEHKKDLAYYYAHKRKDTGEPPAPPPVHVPLHKTASDDTLRRETISSYSFLDEEAAVKLYVPLEGVGQLDEASISSRFEANTFEVLVRGHGGDESRVLALGAKRLHGEIEPSVCRVKRLRDKLVITLAKKPGEDGRCSRWHRLTP